MRPLPLLMLTTALLLGACGKKDNNNKVLSKSKPYPIERPFANVKTPVMTQEIDPTKAQTVRFERGIEVEVPADAFVDKNGNKVTAPVQLHLEVYDSPAEVIASGIPMQFNDQNFESGGMFKLTGTAQGQDISIQQGKTLDVAYPSASTSDFNVYYLRQDAAGNGTWEELQTAPTIDYPKDAVKGNFKLKFSNDTSAVFADLEGIDWKLATHERNPNNPDFAWALAQNWDELEISQPLYGFGKRVWADTNNCWYFTTDKERIYVHRYGNENLSVMDSKSKKHLFDVHPSGKGYSGISSSDEYFYDFGNSAARLYDKNGKLLFDGTDKCWSTGMNSELKRLLWTDLKNNNTYVLADLSGKEIKRFEATPDNDASYYPDPFFTNNDKYICYTSPKGVQLFDANGALVKEITEQVYHVSEPNYYYKENTPRLYLIGIIYLDGTLELWDYEKDKRYRSNAGDFDMIFKKDTYKQPKIFALVPSFKAALIHKGNRENDYLWFYEKGETLELPQGNYYLEYQYDTLKPSLLVSSVRDGGMLSIYDPSKRAEILNLKSVFHVSGSGDMATGDVSFSKDNQHFVVNYGSHSQLHKFSGEMVADFRTSDTAIVYTYFITNDVVGTLSFNGTFRTWSVATGQQLSSKVVDNAFYLMAFTEHKDKISAYDRIFGSTFQYDLYGNLQYSIGSLSSAEDDHDSTLLHESYYKDRHCFMAQRFELGKQMYQLYLSNKGKKFITYVYLSQQDMDIIKRYYAFKLERANKEVGRQEREARLLRRFAIAEFGIYNYDRLWMDTETVKLIADFDFGQPVDKDKIIIFLVCNYNGKSVVKLPSDKWDKFSFYPNAQNQLLAVLPDDKIAVFSPSDFAALDVEALKKAGKHTFKMRVLDEKVVDIAAIDGALAGR